MPLIDQVDEICQRLAPAGWGDLFRQHGLDIEADNLATELTRPLTTIDRRVAGFEDFALEGTQGITPSIPGHSLLYHGLASPNVLNQADGTLLEVFPTLAELDVIENYVYGIDPPSLQDIIARAGARGNVLALAVFALEYRPAIGTVHQRHADLCFARSGVARVGVAPAHYEPSNRGFVAYREGDDDDTIRVMPARYAAYIAIQRPGNANDFGPARFNLGLRYRQSTSDDGDLNFWVPLHKLFDGPECIRDMDLTLLFDMQHTNEKLRRIHLENAGGGRGFDTGWNEPAISQPPFISTEGIAEWSTAGEFGPNLIMPIIHDHLVEAVTLDEQSDEQPVALQVPPNRSDFAPSLTISSAGQERRAPEYVHIRHELLESGELQSLNNFPDMVRRTFAGNYPAQHYQDFAGDGWIRVNVPELANQLPRTVPAYSLVTAPDFYPSVDQRQVMEWWEQTVPTRVRDFMWEAPPPLTLSDNRLAPNLQLADVDFRAEDLSVTSIVVHPLPLGQAARQPTRIDELKNNRNGWLPDAAAGVFAPGWDTSRDSLDGNPHLSAYGLGSPFPEDAKLCAALSAFWPAVAPDSSRQYAPQFPTVCPPTDAEVGLESGPAWDGVRGPRLVHRGSRIVAEYTRFEYADYVENALGNRFSLALTSQIDFDEYTARILAMHRAYRAVGLESSFEKRSWGVLSFRHVDNDDTDLATAQNETGVTLFGQRFRFELYRAGQQLPHPGNHRMVHVEIDEHVTLYVGALDSVLVRPLAGEWRVNNG